MSPALEVRNLRSFQVFLKVPYSLVLVFMNLVLLEDILVICMFC